MTKQKQVWIGNAPDGQSVMAMYRRPGQRVLLHLPDGGQLEITVDHVSDGAVALVLAAGKPWSFGE